MSENICRLFVYGTLRSDLAHSAHDMMSGYFSLVGKATVQGRLYNLGEYPGAVPATGEAFVTGELYEAKDEASFPEAIAVLDAYEGIDDVNSDASLFRRKLVTVYIDGATMPAWIYWYHGPATGVIIPSGDYKKG